MANFALTNTSKFPNGTSVAAHDATGHDVWPGTAPGAAIDTQTMTNGTLTFTGLTAGKRYFAVGTVGGSVKYVKFTAGADVPEGSAQADLTADETVVGDWTFQGDVAFSGGVNLPDDAVLLADVADDAVGAAQLRDDGATDANRAVTTNHVRDNAITQAKVGDDAIGAAELKITLEDVTVGTGNPSGTATVVAGAIPIGIVPVSNQDQHIDSVLVSGTTLTVTLAANATADNVFKVVVLEP